MGTYELTWARLALVILVTLASFIAYAWSRKWLHRYGDIHSIEEHETKEILRAIAFGSFLFWLLLVVYVAGLDINLFSREGVDVRITGILAVLCVIYLARIADKIISARILEEMQNRQAHEYLQYQNRDERSNISRIIKYCLITLVAIIGVRAVGMDFNISEVTFRDTIIPITLSKIFTAILVIFIARLIVWMFVNLVLFSWYNRNKIDIGKQYAYNQLLSYVLYTIAVIIALQYLGVNFTLVWAGAAALLVGVGFALQQVISDFFSGLVILFERSIEVGDFLDFGNFTGTVKKVGLRASVIETLERKDVIIPNSHLVNDNVTNWTRSRPVTRFDVRVGVAYGSDTQLVKNILLEVVKETPGILSGPIPFVRFLEFGDSSLNFSVFFFSSDVARIEDIKSDVRFRIDQAFRENSIEIPFPQRDVWIKSNE